MYYVYLLCSLSSPNKTYTGFSTNLKQRVVAHNNGESKHTAKYMPWKLISYHAFADEGKARVFEHYLKTGSGQAFAKRHFW